MLQQWKDMIWANNSNLTRLRGPKWWWRVREMGPLFQKNLGWWNIIVWLDMIERDLNKRFGYLPEGGKLWILLLADCFWLDQSLNFTGWKYHQQFLFTSYNFHGSDRGSADHWEQTKSKQLITTSPNLIMVQRPKRSLSQGSQKPWVS